MARSESQPERVSPKTRRAPSRWKVVRRWSLLLHRELGFLFSGVVVIYAVSGLAVNHSGDWDPGFIVDRVSVPSQFPDTREAIDEAAVRRFVAKTAPEASYRTFDFPSPLRMKIFLGEGSISGLLGGKTMVWERVRKRPLLHGFNRLHLHPERWWLVFSDAFCIGLLVIVVTGLILPRGRLGLAGQGKWWVGAGVCVPLAALIFL